MDSIDTRLLSVFDEIYRARSVSLAADALELGQPAVSVALSKLRHHFGDPLFVRTSSGMAPTPFADGLASRVRTAMEALEAVLGHRNDFDAEKSTRIFRICMADISQLVLRHAYGRSCASVHRAYASISSRCPMTPEINWKLAKWISRSASCPNW